MKRVYCDTGGYRRELQAMEAGGQIELVTYGYENRNRKIPRRAPSSNPTWDEGDSIWDDETGTWNDYKAQSDRWPALVCLIGPQNLRDAKHLESAYRADCDAFLTSDYDDIVARAEEIYITIGVRVFHSTKQWDAFVKYIESAA